MKKEEEPTWSHLSVNDMSDEEDGDGGFKEKTPKDRARDVADLIAALDQRHEEKLSREDRRTVRVNRPRKEL